MSAKISSNGLAEKRRALLGEKARLEAVSAGLISKINAAVAQRRKTGKYADPVWFADLRNQRWAINAEIQSVEAQLREIRAVRREEAEATYCEKYNALRTLLKEVASELKDYSEDEEEHAEAREAFADAYDLVTRALRTASEKV